MVHLALVTGDYLMLNSEFLAECVFVFCRLWLWYYFLEVALFGSWFHGKDGLSSLKQSITYLSVCWPKQGLRKLILCLLFILVCEITCFEWQCSEAMISVIMLDWGRRRMLLLEACVQKLLSQVALDILLQVSQIQRLPLPGSGHGGWARSFQLNKSETHESA